MEQQVRLDQLGRGRLWAERAADGESIAVVEADGRPVAYLVPATEPITEKLITWYLDQSPRLDKVSRMSACWLWHVMGDATAGRVTPFLRHRLGD